MVVEARVPMDNKIVANLAPSASRECRECQECRMPNAENVKNAENVENAENAENAENVEEEGGDLDELAAAGLLAVAASNMVPTPRKRKAIATTRVTKI